VQKAYEGVNCPKSGIPFVFCEQKSIDLEREACPVFAGDNRISGIFVVAQGELPLDSISK
jgi:hypothetical protein